MKNLQTAFITRQHMLSRDFELYYYNDHNLSKVDLHSHNYYEFYFLWKVMSAFRSEPKFTRSISEISCWSATYPTSPDHSQHGLSLPAFCVLDQSGILQPSAADFQDYAYLMQHVQVSQNYFFQQTGSHSMPSSQNCCA